jgi:pimeloyl-ACP methyl ester carboxylesterase
VASSRAFEEVAMRKKAIVLFSILAFILIGAAATLAGMIGFSAPVNPPPLASLQAAGAALGKNLSDLPQIENFKARDGTAIAFRSYQAATDKIAVLVHGSSAAGFMMHPMGRALASAGISAYALDIRGHGLSGPKGDVAYVGQLEDDVEDFLKSIAAKHPNAKRILIGFSSGGAFTLRFAGGAKGELFDGYLAMAPYVGEDAPSNRPQSGGWVSAAVPRIVGLLLLDRIGIRQFGYLPVLGFAVPEEQRGSPNRTAFYSYRLWLNFGTPRDWRSAVRSIRRPMIVLGGANDELFLSDKLDETFRLVRNDIKVEVVPGLDHMQIVTEAPAIAAAINAARALLPAQ